jgi:type III pantothenate kinase
MDRRVQALAAWTLGAGPAVVVSAGTALTIDAAGADGSLAGGAIAAGLSLCAKSLTIGTAGLPLVDLKGPTPSPAPDTETAIRLGVVVGAAGAVERLVESMRPSPSCPVFLTGADAPYLAPHLKIAHRTHPGLGLLGIALALRRSPPLAGAGSIGGS